VGRDESQIAEQIIKADRLRVSRSLRKKANPRATLRRLNSTVICNVLLTMGKKFKVLKEKHIEFIKQQHIFYVGSAGAEGTVNVSPKGMDTLRVINERKVVWLNLTGSGNETSAHVQENGRMTIMFCSFAKQPLILRLYGKSKVIHPRDSKWKKLSSLFDEHVGARQFFHLNIELVQASCGSAVPFFEYRGERESLIKWANRRRRHGIKKYWKEQNKLSLDGKPTNILKNS
jgi:hypothetical protein